MGTVLCGLLILLFEIVVSILFPIRIILANDFEIVICENERIDVFRPDVVADPADNIHAASLDATYIQDPAIRKNDQIGLL